MSERKIFRDLVSVDKAKEVFDENIGKIKYKTEKLPLLQCLGRVLVNDILSPINVPPFDRAAMDGFAVISKDTVSAEEDHPITLKVIGEIKAGHVFDGIVTNGAAVEISTGAPMPTGSDSVVMVEYTDRTNDIVEIRKVTTPGDNTMSAGGDIQEGERVLASRTLLTSRELSVLAAMGIHTVEVFQKPKIGIFSSGDEVVAHDQPLQPGKLYDINSTSIASSIIENGGDPVILGIIPDKYDELRIKLEQALPNYDILIISGGTSAGMGDMLYDIIDKLGKPGLLVHGVKVKPGKPTILAVCNGKPVIGLPGYPASALSIHSLFVIPLVRKFAQLSPLERGIKVKAKIRQKVRSDEGRHEFKPMNLVKFQDDWYSFPVPGGSGAITSIALADGFVEIPEGVSYLPEGSTIEITLFSKELKPTDVQIIGSHCVALARLQALFSQKYPQYNTRSIAVGSTGGVAAIRRGEAHIAGIHILDKEKGYNSTFETDETVIIPGYYRMQGFIVQKGNPKKIYGINDLVQPNLTFLNRNKGSGTRILFDALLEKAGIDPKKINGYNSSAKSHSSAAQAVRSGHIDVTIGIESVVGDDLDFIPLREEEYDLLTKKEYLKIDAVNSFIDLLKSEEFKSIIKSLPGYRLKE